jgi:TatD DNase family protein
MNQTRGRGRGRGDRNKHYNNNNSNQQQHDEKFIALLTQTLSTLSSETRFCDTHVHLEYIIQKKQNRNQVLDGKGMVNLLQDQFAPRNCPAQVRESFFKHFDACIAIFCDTAALSPSLGLWQDLLDDSNHKSFKIYGAFGIHPHNAKYYNEFCYNSITECLKHPNAVAYGEVSSIFSFLTPC